MQLDQTLVFCISLKSRVNAKSWVAVSRLLSATLKSIYANTNKKFMIVIAGHEKPDVDFDLWEKTVFLEAPFPMPKPDTGGKGWDKLKKRRLAASWVKQNIDVACRLVFLDADDLVSKYLIDYAFQYSHDTSIIIDAGYRLDARNGVMERIPRRFSRYCGSCFLPVFKKEELPDVWNDEDNMFALFDSHSKFKHVCEETGKKVELLRRESIVYLVNHTDSLEYAKKGFKDDIVDGNVTSVERDEILRSTFSFQWHLA